MLLTVSNAAKQLGVTRQAVYWRLLRGTVKGRKIGGVQFVVMPKK